MRNLNTRGRSTTECVITRRQVSEKLICVELRHPASGYVDRELFIPKDPKSERAQFDRLRAGMVLRFDMKRSLRMLDETPSNPDYVYQSLYQQTTEE